MASSGRLVEYGDFTRGLRAGDDVTALASLEQLAVSFARQNADALTSPNLQSSSIEDVGALIAKACGVRGCIPPHVQAALLRVVRLVSRKPANQKYASPSDMGTLVQGLEEALEQRALGCCADICGALANFSSNNKAIAVFLAGRAAQLLTTCLMVDDTHVGLLSAAAHAVQAVGMTIEGKRACIETDVVPVLLALAGGGEDSVVAAAAGALHNLSNHRLAAPQFRELGGVGLMVELLSHRDTEVKRCAAGALQGLARDAECLKVIRSSDATRPLVELLLEDDVGVQVAAIAALLNIHGSDEEEKGKRDVLKKLMSCMITSSCLRDAYCTPSSTPAATPDPSRPATACSQSCSPVPDVNIPDDWLCN